jgi:hypothetical protein
MWVESRTNLSKSASILDVAYILPTLADDPLRNMTCRIYEVLRAIHSANERSEVIRVIRKHPDTNRKRL